MAGVRTSVLTAVGGSWPVTLWAKWKCRGFCSVRRAGSALELRKEDRAVLLAAKHSFFAPKVCENFDAFAVALPLEMRDGVWTADFSKNTDTFNISNTCLGWGAVMESRNGALWLKKDTRAMILAPQHLIYAPDMAEKFDIYFSPLVPSERDGMQVLDYSKPGNVQTYRGSGLAFEMASFPEEEEAIEEYFKWYRPKAGDLVFDMGAHCGVSTYHLSRLVGPEGKVIAFEPDPVNFAILLRNIARHGMANVTAVNVAVAGTNGKLAFNSEGTIGSSLVSLLGRESAGSVLMVDAMTLQDAFAQYGVPVFCKIDIEGAEVDVIAKSGELLRGCKTQFALDTNHPKADGKCTDKEIEALFQSYGYETLSQANPLLTTWARPK